MTKKRLISILLAALMLLGTLHTALAEAQHTPYIPGELTQTRFAEAFEKGDAVCASMGMSLSMNAELLGLTDEEADAMNVVLDALRNAQLSVAAVKVEDGVILELAGAYFKDENTYAGLDVQLEITKTGLALTSDTLIPGERVTVTWETVLAMLGLDEATSAQILALRDMTAEEILELAASTLGTYSAMALQIAEPYMQILSDFIDGLPATSEENVASDDPFPAAAQETTVVVTEKALGQLIVALCNQLEADTMLAPMIDAYMVMNADADEEPLTTAALCAALREGAADMTDEDHPLYIITGTDAGNDPLYISIGQSSEDGSTVVFNWINTATTSDEVAFHLEAFTADAQQVYANLSCDVQYTGDPADPNVADLHVAANFEENEQSLLNAAFDLAFEPTITEDGMSGYKGSYTCDLTLTDEDETVTMSIDGTADTALTPEGGEITYSACTLNVQTGGTTMQQTVEESMHLMEDENGPLVEYREFLTMPLAGIDEVFFYTQVYTVPYTPDETLTELALESATSEDMDALLSRVTANAQAQLEALITLLPEELLALMEADEEPATVEETE